MLDDLLVGDDGLAPFGAEAPTHALMGGSATSFWSTASRYTLAVRRGCRRAFLPHQRLERPHLQCLIPRRAHESRRHRIGKFEREEWVTSVVLAPAERYIVDVEFVAPGP